MPQPPAEARQQVIDWIQAMRANEARKNAGDPGRVLARRLSNAEYNYTIRDLTGVDIRPAREFPVDPANTAGFDNSGESLTMSPALLNKYLQAAREVADHMVLTPDGFDLRALSRCWLRRIAINTPSIGLSISIDASLPIMRIISRPRGGSSIGPLWESPPPRWPVLRRKRKSARSICPWSGRLLEEAGSREGRGWPDRQIAGHVARPAGARRNQPDMSARQMCRDARFRRQDPQPYSHAIRRPSGERICRRDSAADAELEAATEVRELAPPRFRSRSDLRNDTDPAAGDAGNSEAIPGCIRKPRRAGPLSSAKARAGDQDLVVPAAERSRYEASFARFASVFPDTFYVKERGRYFPDDSRGQGTSPERRLSQRDGIFARRYSADGTDPR